ncbi:hypothetical protein LTR37_004856 [Vermiconidia calcicola]|uniref:Uncharacterized protein n=1 Tax=Vermiconidia calcicola TaxID=1690605 RepID=A0ACC3NNE3_9PEZI|nr:hypothetical protein LTR37_004856 [Vermiconidia calcicola]
MKDLLRDLIRKIVELIEQVESDGLGEGQLNDGYYRLAMFLGHFDDDSNALAALLQYMPTNMSVTCVEEGGSEEKSQVQERAPQIEPSGQPQAMEVLSVSTQTKAPRLIPVAISKQDETIDFVKPTVERPVSIFCEGTCGTEWTYADNFYACRDCVDTNLCASCYTKLKSLELEVPDCAPDHSHLHIPPLDERASGMIPADRVMVGQTSMLREDWLEMLKKEWQIDEESLKAARQFADAAHKIQRAWRIFKLGRKSERPQAQKP